MEMESRVRIESTQASTSPQDEKNNVTTSLQSATVTRAQHDVDIHAVEAQLTNGTVEGWRLAVLAFRSVRVRTRCEAHKEHSESTKLTVYFSNK